MLSFFLSFAIRYLMNTLKSLSQGMLGEEMMQGISPSERWNVIRNLCRIK